MNALTLAKYLFGSRDAILRIAQTPQAIWLGLSLVLSTGLAREYDGEDLLHEPWHLLLPLGASLVTATVLFGLLWLICSGWRTMRPISEHYRSFLALYWMTAPLAWLYAIPVERFLTAAGATQVNLWLLAIVALWRVVLMVRVVSVILPLKVWQALMIVMLFADSVALSILSLTPLPIFSIMGGIRLTESESMIQSASCFVIFWGNLTWPVWFIGTLVAAYAYRSAPVSDWIPTSRDTVDRSAWYLAAASIFAGLAVLPFTQPEQQLRHQVESDLEAGNYETALRTMSEKGRDAFPPHWDPPPRIAYRNQKVPLIDVMEALEPSQASPWLVEVYREKFVALTASPNNYFTGYWPSLDNKEFDRHLDVIERHFAPNKPVDPEVAKEDPFADVLQRELDPDARSRTPAQKERIIKLVGKPDWLKKKEEQSSLQQDEQHDDG